MTPADLVPTADYVLAYREGDVFTPVLGIRNNRCGHFIPLDSRFLRHVVAQALAHSDNCEVLRAQ